LTDNRSRFGGRKDAGHAGPLKANPRERQPQEESLRLKPELQGAAFFVFDEEAGVFDDEKTSGSGFLGRGWVRDSLLEPEDSGADGDGGIGDGKDLFGTAEDVDDIDAIGNVFEACVGFFAENFGFVGVNGDDAVAGRLEVGGNFVGGAAGIGREPNDRDVFVDAEKLRNEVRSGGDVGRQMEKHER
jgi:hypothetical protein